MWLLVPALLAAAALCSADSDPCASTDNFNVFCDDDIWASIEVTMMNETVLAVPIRRRWIKEEASTTQRTTTLTTTTTTTTTTPSPTTTTEHHSPRPVYIHDFDDYNIYWDEDQDYDVTSDVLNETLVDDFNDREAEREREQRRKEEEEEAAFRKRYCEDNELEVNTRHTGVGAPRKYEVFPGVGIYWFHRSPLSWEQARRRCEENRGHLLLLDSEEEWTVVSGLLQRCPKLLDNHYNQYLYLGASDQLNNGHYVTVLGDPLEPLQYGRWANDQHKDGGNCLVVGRDGLFNRLPCHTPLPFVCEFDA